MVSKYCAKTVSKSYQTSHGLLLLNDAQPSVMLVRSPLLLVHRTHGIDVHHLVPTGACSTGTIGRDIYVFTPFESLACVETSRACIACANRAQKGLVREMRINSVFVPVHVNTGIKCSSDGLQDILITPSPGINKKVGRFW